MSAPARTEVKIAPRTEGAAATAANLSTRRLLLLCIPFFWSALYIYNSYLSVYAESINPSLSLVGVIVAAYGFTQLVLRIPVGITSDRLGRRKPFVLAGALFGSLSCAALLIAPQSWVLVLGRGLAGVAAACWVPLTVLLVATYPQDQMVKATSMATALSAIGMTIASAAGGALAQATNLRVPFWVGIALGLATAVMVGTVREPRAAAKKPVSIPALVAVGRVPIVLAVSLFAMLNQYVSWSMTHAFIPIYAKELGVDNAGLGMLMSVWQGVYALFSFASGPLGMRLGTRWSVALGLLLSTLGVALTPLTGSIVPLALLRALHGAGVGIMSPVAMAGAVSAVAPEKRGAAMGFFQSIYAIGMVAGPAVSGVFADSLGLTPTFLITGALSLLTAGAAVLFLPNKVRQVTA